MIELYYWPTPNGHKTSICLEETGLAYRLIPVNIGRGEQFQPDFLAISPNNRIPAIVDHDVSAGDDRRTLFESGAILLYLAEKTNQFLPTGAARYDAIQWLMWQMGGFGPMLGQNHHFRQYAPEKIPYAISRYEKETQRLYAILNRHLANRPFIAGDYSIADMACYPWTVSHERQGIDLTHYPHVKRWFAQIATRPAVIRAYALEATVRTGPTVDEESHQFLFNQTDSAVPNS